MHQDANGATAACTRKLDPPFYVYKDGHRTGYPSPIANIRSPECPKPGVRIDSSNKGSSGGTARTSGVADG